MPITPTYPGVYIEEVPSGVRTIVGVATSITAFIGRVSRGPVDDPTRIQSFAEFERAFGGLSIDSTMSYAVQQYFLNGGTDAIIVRVVHGGDANINDNANKATLLLPGALELEAANEGTWGNELRALVDHTTRDSEPGEDPDSLFNLTVRDAGTGATESFLNLSTDPNNGRFVTRVLEQGSTLVRVATPGTVPKQRPTDHTPATAGEDPFEVAGSHTPSTNDGRDGDALTDDDVKGEESEKTGIFALEKADLFNLLCIPPLSRNTDPDPNRTLSPALAYCKKRRAMLIVDPPIDWDRASDVMNPGSGVDNLGLRDENAAIYFPRVRMPDPLKENRVEEFVPCGVVAGVVARTDAQRGVFKAPAGQEATLFGVRELTVKLTDGEQGQLNSLGVNCLRNRPIVGNVVWGARTLKGADRLASEWKYVPVRRLALFLEETLYRNLQWVVVEPNDEPLWAQIRLNVGAFMQNLFRQRAFQGTSPREAYFVKCDKETTTQNNIDLGIVNVLVGFAPLKPAEFVILKIQQMAGQVQTSGGLPMARFSVNPSRFDPYKNFKFRVKWDGRYVAGVSKVGALRRTTEVVEQREGGDPSTSRKSPGRTTYEAITLERGVTHDTEFEKWANKVWNFGAGEGSEVSLADFRKDILIDFFNEAGQKVLSYKVYRCWVSEFQALPELDANANAVAIQTIKLENEGWERDLDVAEPAEPAFTEPPA